MVFTRLSQKDFFFVKSFMGVPLDWKIFTQKKNQLPARAQEGIKIKKSSVRVKIFLIDICETREFSWAKTPLYLRIEI